MSAKALLQTAIQSVNAHDARSERRKDLPVLDFAGSPGRFGGPVVEEGVRRLAEAQAAQGFFKAELVLGIRQLQSARKLVNQPILQLVGPVPSD